MSEGITAIMDREREALVTEAVAIRDSGAWVMHDGERWYAMRIGSLVATGEGATVEEALQGLEVRQWPYSSARPEHPGVVLQFMRKKEMLTFRSLKYASFEENLRAIALTMDALRRVDRYGVVEGEQYQGFKQIASPAADSRLEKLIRLRDGAATEGERQAAQSAINRLQQEPTA